MLLQVLACSPHDGVFMECVDIKTIESEIVQLLKGSAIHCRQLENNFQNGQVVVYCWDDMVDYQSNDSWYLM